MDRINAMGYHLYCDVAHDFGADAPVYNINGKDAAGTVGATAMSEDACVSFFMNGDGMSMIADGVARASDSVTFTIPDKTSSFEQWKAPILYLGGNDKIGIIQDAGEFITQRLGAKNVLTFGSILDPAGKPVRPDQAPIWYNPAVNRVTIPLQPFGFDPAAIRSIEVYDLTAGTVKSKFVTTNEAIDAVAMSPPSRAVPGGQAKPINQTKINLAGFFTSIEKANNLKEELVTDGIAEKSVIDALNGRYLKYFYIGKTLGDAMLVASGLPRLPDDSADNPYYNVGGPGWKSWTNGGDVAPPALQILKTGDRLNWLRAVLFGLGSILEQQASGTRKTKQYQYFPGSADPESIRVAILRDFDAIQAEVDGRYAALAESLGLLLDGTGAIIPSTTVFAPGGMQLLPSGVPSILAGRLIQEVQAGLLSPNKAVTEWIASRKAEAQANVSASLPDLRAYYQETLDRANACSPPSTSIIVQKGKQDGYLSMKCIVANVPRGAVGWPLSSSIDIALRNAFDRIRKATVVSDLEYSSRVAGTDIQRRFFGNLPAQIQRGGADDTPLDIQSLTDTVTEVVGDIEMEGGQRGGAFVVPQPLYPIDEFEGVIQQSFPRLYDFLQYVGEIGFNQGQSLLLVYDIVRQRTTNRIVDPVLLEDLLNDVSTAMGFSGGTPYFTFQYGDPAVFTAEYELPKNTPSSRATVLFDAYTYFVNARNASQFMEGELPTQSTTDFKTIEQIYLDKVGITRLRSGTPLLPSPVTTTRLAPKDKYSSDILAAQKTKRIDKAQSAQETRRAADKNRRRIGFGGLRTRRPLYGNAVETAARTSGDEGLRERRGTRRASRVRQ